MTEQTAIVIAGEAAIGAVVVLVMLLLARSLRREIREHDERMAAEFALVQAALRRGRSPEQPPTEETADPSAEDGPDEPDPPRRRRRASPAVDPKQALRLRALGR